MLNDVSNAEKGGENYDMDVPPKLNCGNMNWVPFLGWIKYRQLLDCMKNCSERHGAVTCVKVSVTTGASGHVYISLRKHL